MAKSKITSSFRFDDDFIDLLNAWAFVSKKGKGGLLQDAFREYCSLERNSLTADKVNKVMDCLKGD